MAARQAHPGLYQLHHYDPMQVIKWKKISLDSLWELEAVGHIPVRKLR